MKTMFTKRLVTLCVLMALVCGGVVAQPTVLGTQLANGTYTTYNLNTVGGFKQYRLQASSSAAANARVWEFASGTAASTDYTTNWRPYTSNNTLSTNIYIPTSFANGAKYNTGSGGASGLLQAITGGNYYTFNVSNNATADNIMELLETSFSPVTMSGISQYPAVPTTTSGVTVTFTTSAAPNASENIFLRYSTDNFTTSNIVLATVTGTNGRATIPAIASGTVKYYLFSTVRNAAGLASDVTSYGQTAYDMGTLNLLNNSNSNYSYTVGGAFSTYERAIGFTSTYTALSGATAITLSGDDAISTSITLPFTFNYAGTAYTKMQACTNGWLTLNTGTDATSTAFTNSALFTTTTPNITIAPWFDDLTGSGTVSYLTSGTAPNRTFTLQYASYPTYASVATSTINFQVVFYESSNAIEFRYGSATNAIHSTSESASAGLEWGTGGPSNFRDAFTGSTTVGNAGMNSENYPTNQVVRFYPVSATPAALAAGTYTVASGGTYPTLSDAIADLNQRGVAGAVNFNCTATSYPISSANMYPFLIGAVTGTSSSNTVTFTGNGSGSNALLSFRGEYSSPSVYYAAGSTFSTVSTVNLIGSDYVTFKNFNIDLSQTAPTTTAFTSPTSRGIYVINNTAIDGATNNTFQNISVALDRTNTSSIGIHQYTATSPTSAAGANSGNKYYNLTIANVYSGIYMQNTSTSTTFFPDLNGEIGNTTANTFNIIGSSTTNDIGNGTAQTWGIRATSWGGKIYNNEVKNVTGTSTTAIDGIFLENTNTATGSIGTVDIYNNKVHDIASTSTSTTSHIISGIRVNTTANAASIARVYNNFVYSLNNASLNTSSRQLIGIRLQDGGSGAGSTINADFNNVSIAPSSVGCSNACLEIGTTSGPVINVRNNAFANTTASQTTVKHYDVVSTAAATVGSGSWNRNIYYVTNTNGFTGLTSTTDRTTLSDWQTAVAQDANSYNQNPQFVSATDLHISSTLATPVESNGSYFSGAITWTGTDIDGTTRNATTPDIGADEGTFVALTLNDMQATAFVTPINGATIISSSSFTPQASFTNNGLNTQTNVPVTYSILDAGNNVVYTSSTTIASLASGATATVTFSSASITVAGTYTIKAVAALTTDQVTSNDQITGAITVLSPLAGDYLIGTAQTAPFNNLATAITRLNTVGVSAAVRFLLTDASYNLGSTGITINAITGGSVTNTFTLRPNTGVASATITSSSTLATIKLNGADYVTIDGSNSGGTDKSLTIINTDAGGGSDVVWIGSASSSDGALSNTVKNTIIKGSGQTATYHGIFAGSGTTIGNVAESANTNLIVQNNTVIQTSYGVAVAGNSAGQAGVSILNNIIGSSTASEYIGYCGVFISNSTGAKVNNNSVLNIITTSTNPTGIYIGGNVLSSTFNANKIDSIRYTGTSGYGGKGFDINTGSTTSNLIISNNMISRMGGDGWNTLTDDAIIGIRIGATAGSTTTTGGVSLYYNSINLGNGTFAGNSSGTLSAALYISSSATSITLVNNVLNSNLVNTGASGAKTYAIYSSAAKTVFSSIDNNDYYITGSQGVLANIGSADKTTLAAIQTDFGGNTKSATALPGFTSTSDLHIPANTATVLESGGVAIAGITTDIDAETRPNNSVTNLPDIGADEFAGVQLTAPTITLITGPIANCTTAVSHSVSVNVVSSSSPVATVTLNYNNGTSGTVTMSLTSGTVNNGVWSGIIPAGSIGLAVTWSVTATNAAALSSIYTGASYADGSLVGVTATASTSASNICSGNSVTLTGTFGKSTTLGAGASTTTGSNTSSTTYVSPFGQYYGGMKTQYLIKASELTALGIYAGNITALGINVSALDAGTNSTYQNFAVNMAPTTATVLTTTMISSNLTTVYSNPAGVTHIVGINTYTFTTPFVWDGTSNIIIQMCWSNNVTGNSTFASSEVKYDALGFVCESYYRADAVVASTLCGSTSASGTTSSRPQFIFTTTPTFTSYAWSDGTNTVGTTNPLTYNPSNTGNSPVTNSYTVKGTDANGCSVTSSGVNVVINPNQKITLTSASGSDAQAVCSGNSITSITYNVTGTGILGASVVISPSGSGFSGSYSSGTFTISGIAASVTTTTTYSYTITTSGNCTAATANGTITVNPLPKVFNLTSGSFTVCYDGSNAPDMKLDGSETGVAYTLLRNGTPVTTITATGTSGVDFGTQSVGGTYTATAKNPAANGGCTVNMGGSATVTVSPQIFAYTVGGSGIFCGQAFVTLSNSQSNITYSLFNNGLGTGQSQSGTTGAALSFTVTTSGSYTIVANSGSCFNGMNGTANITVNPIPSVAGTYTPLICSGSTFTVTPTSSVSGTTYTWTTPTYTGSVSGGSAQTTGQINVSGTLSNSGVNSGTATYTVTPTANTCAGSTFTVAVTVDATLAATSISATSPICSGQGTTVAFSGAANSKVYYTANGGSQQFVTLNSSGNYQLTVPSLTTSTTYALVSATSGTTGSTCSQTLSGSATVTVNPLPTLTSTGSGSKDQTICRNNNIVPITYTTGGGATTLTLTGSLPGLTVTGNGTSTITISGIPTNVGNNTYTIATNGGSCGSVSISGNIILQSYITWTGSSDNKWNVAGNWCSGFVPSATDDVLIPASASVYPKLNTNTTLVGGVNIETGATIDLNGKDFTTGAVTGGGKIIGTVPSTMTVTASSTLNFDAVNNTIQNLNINAGNVNLASDLNITGGANYGIVTVANNAILAIAANAHLILKSDTLGTAAVATNSGTATYITGNVTVERFIPISNVTQTRTGRAWRFLSPSVTGTTIGEAWQENLLYGGNVFHKIGTNTVVSPPSGYGTMITGYTQHDSATANGNGYDFWSAIANSSSSIRSFQFATSSTTTGSWLSLSSISGKLLNSEQAYMLFVRGDRSITTGAGHTTLRAIGTLKQLDQPVSIDRTKAFLAVGNPYPSTIDWNTIYQRSKTFMQDKFVVWDSKKSTYGAYILVQGTGNGHYSYVPFPIGSNNPTNNDDARFIPSGAGFFVYPQPGTGTNSLLITEADKNAAQTPLSDPFRLVPDTDKKLWVNLNLKDADTTILADGLLARFDATYDSAVNDDDAQKVTNFNENLGIVHNDLNLMVEARKEAEKSDTLHLKLWNVTQRAYQLQVVAANWINSSHAWLEDHYLQTKQELSLTGSVTTVDFSVNGDAASSASDRFDVVFQNDEVLPVMLTSVKAAASNGGVQVNWTVTNEVNIKQYTIERSTDGGATYTTLGTQAAKNNSGAALTSYDGFDAAPKLGDNLYRIRIEAKDGTVTYSQIVKVTIGGNGGILITMYPNPVRQNGKVNLQLSNLAAGNYLVSVFSEGGQSVYQKKITIAQPNTVQSEELKLGAGLAQGSYQVRITNSKGTVLFLDKLVVGR